MVAYILASKAAWTCFANRLIKVLIFNLDLLGSITLLGRQLLNRIFRQPCCVIFSLRQIEITGIIVWQKSFPRKTYSNHSPC